MTMHEMYEMPVGACPYEFPDYEPHELVSPVFRAVTCNGAWYVVLIETPDRDTDSPVCARVARNGKIIHEETFPLSSCYDFAGTAGRYAATLLRETVREYEGEK